MFSDKCENDSLIKTLEGMNYIKDALFILRRICLVAKDPEPVVTDDVNDISELPEISNLQVPAPSNKSTKRRSKRTEVTMPVVVRYNFWLQ